MERDIEHYLRSWKEKKDRKPIILRGARQVGKTYIVRKFGNLFENIVEVNFEKIVEAKGIFEGDLDPVRIIRDLSILKNQNINPGRTLLFLDEVQEAPRAIKALRYFYEELPDLHVVVAGSLIDFVLENHGVPVGRTAFLYLYPMSFTEFLKASKNPQLSNEILNFDFEKQIPEFIHNKLLEYLAVYMAIGGMPEVVKAWIEKEDIKECQAAQANIVSAYKQDFGKYAKKYQLKYIDIIFDKIPSLLGDKLQYSNISTAYKARDLAPCLDLLVKAGIIHQVFQSTSAEPPLGANVNLKFFKSVFLDIGLAQSVLGLDLGDWILNPRRSLENKGNVVESFVGQELLAYSNPEQKHTLYYWHRDRVGSKAEVDYVIQKQNGLIPIEVKSGITGGLKSLVSYIKSKKGSFRGVHFSQKQYERRRLYSSLPLYLVKKIFEEKETPSKLVFYPGKLLQSSDMNYLVNFIVNTGKLFGIDLKTNLSFRLMQKCSAADNNRILEFIDNIYEQLGLLTPQWTFKKFKPGQLIKSEDINEIVRSVITLRMF